MQLSYKYWDVLYPPPWLMVSERWQSLRLLSLDFLKIKINENYNVHISCEVAPSVGNDNVVRHQSRSDVRDQSRGKVKVRQSLQCRDESLHFLMTFCEHLSSLFLIMVLMLYLSKYMPSDIFCETYFYFFWQIFAISFCNEGLDVLHQVLNEAEKC